MNSEAAACSLLPAMRWPPYSLTQLAGQVILAATMMTEARGVRQTAHTGVSWAVDSGRVWYSPPYSLAMSSGSPDSAWLSKVGSGGRQSVLAAEPVL